MYVNVTAGVTSGLALLFGVEFFCFWVMKKRKKDLEEASDDVIEHELQDLSRAPRVQKFRFKELKKATHGLSTRRTVWRRVDLELITEEI